RLCFRHQSQGKLKHNVEKREGTPATQQEQFVVGGPTLKLSLLRTDGTADSAASQTHQQRERKAHRASMRPIICKTGAPLLNQIQELRQQFHLFHYESSRSGIRASVFGAVRISRSCRDTRLLIAETTDSRSSSTPNRFCTGARMSEIWSGPPSRLSMSTLSQRERDTPAECPSPSGRGCREAAGEGSENFAVTTAASAQTESLAPLLRLR